MNLIHKMRRPKIKVKNKNNQEEETTIRDGIKNQEMIPRQRSQSLMAKLKEISYWILTLEHVFDLKEYSEEKRSSWWLLNVKDMLPYGGRTLSEKKSAREKQESGRGPR